MMSIGETVPRAGWFHRSSASQVDDPPRLEIDERLVEQLEFFVGQRLAKIEFKDAARLDGMGHLVAEEAEGAAAVRLGPVERHVGVLQQRIGADIPRRRHGNADAGADLDQVIVDPVTLAQTVDDPPREPGRILVRS